MEVYKEMGGFVLFGWESKLVFFIQFIMLILQVLIFLKGFWILEENECKVLKSKAPFSKENFFNEYGWKCFFF